MEGLIFPARKGRMMRSDIPMQTFYYKLSPHTFPSGSFVDEETIRKYQIPRKLLVDLVHPDSLRIRGAFDFAYEKKGSFTVGVIRIWNGRGDLLMASVIAKALKYKYGKDVKVWFVTLPGYEELLYHNPYVDMVFKSEEALRKAGPDVTFNVSDLEFKAELSEYEREGAIVRNRAMIYLNQIDLYLENRTPAYVVTEEERTRAREILHSLGYHKRTPIIGVQLKGSNASRTYPHMQKVADSLEKDGYQVLILDNFDPQKGYEYKLREVGALVEQLAVTVTPNSFCYHLAGSMKRRAVACFGSCDGEVWTQDYEKVTVAQIDCPYDKPRCWWDMSCVKGNFGQKQEKTADCLKAIPISLIKEKVKEHFKAKKILIVPLTYNFLGLTKQMVDSIRSFHNYDVLVIDNKSTDGTVEWLEEQGIEFISKELSVPEAWNLGMKEAYNRGYDYCLLCNNDIVLSASYIDTIVDVAKRRKSYVVTGNVLTKDDMEHQNLSEQTHDVEKEIETMVAGDYSALLVSRECIKKIGKFNEVFGPRYQSDEDHLLRLRLAGKSIMKTYKTVFYHLLGAVVMKSEETKKQHEVDWVRNVALFKEIWKVDPYVERNKLASLGYIKEKNPDWKKRITIPFEGLKG